MPGETKYVEVLPVIEVELCPKCNSDYTRCVDPNLQDADDCYDNRCLACSHQWKSTFPSAAGVNFIRQEEKVLL